jgi:hypothetical protein
MYVVSTVTILFLVEVVESDICPTSMRASEYLAGYVHTFNRFAVVQSSCWP